MEATLRAYKSLVLHDIPDDVIDLIFEYTGDISQSPEQLANQICMYKVNCPVSSAWFLDGFICTICCKFICIKTERGVHRHCRSKNHKNKISRYLHHTYKLPENFDNLFKIWLNDIMIQTKFKRKHLLWVKQNIFFMPTL